MNVNYRNSTSKRKIKRDSYFVMPGFTNVYDI